MYASTDHPLQDFKMRLSEIYPPQHPRHGKSIADVALYVGADQSVKLCLTWGELAELRDAIAYELAKHADNMITDEQEREQRLGA